MSTVVGCNIPEDLYYLIEKHVWGRREGDVVIVGLTDVAQNLAKGIISVTTKKAGKSLAKGKSLGTVESSKWVGPVPAPVGGEILEVNGALVGDPGLLNRDPYGEGWIAKLAPEDWERDSADLVTGADGVAAYQAFLEQEGISCEEA
ncbi:glycine cleavage system protein H [Conexibacter sp. DBS9H8]|uniref:glycine cleavage system protein H n=1 Tax=Conexibacter sp. DBS9H8 TaxID=2937801 RepID=UPI00200DE7EC|nr:glycine cleavage system protein GcvH [Conexibacter sp. DBS9H8]